MAKKKDSPKLEAPKIIKTSDRVRQAAVDMSAALEQTERLMFYEKRHKGKKLVQLAAEMKATQNALEYIDELHKYLQAEFDTLRLRLIPDQIEAEHLESPVNVSGVGKVVLTPDVLVSVKSGEQEKLYKWLRSKRLGDLIQNTLNSSTLKSFVKGRIQTGKEYPKDFLNVTPLTRASIVKG